MKKFAFAAVISAFTLMGCKTAEQSLIEAGAKPLTATEIKLTVVGNTTNVTLANGVTATSYFNPNGTAFAKNNKSSSDGTWEIKSDGQICINWVKWGGKCVRVYPSGAEFKEIDESGNLFLTVNQIRTGNPEKF